MNDVKKNKFLEIVSMLLFADMEVDNNNCDEILLLKEGEGNISCFCNEYVRALPVCNNILDIEFFTESDNAVEINIKNQKEEIIYDLKIFTAPTLHVLVDTKCWNKGLYSINIVIGDSIVFNAFVC